VAGVGATAFGEHWDRSAGDLLGEAVDAALEDAGVALEEIEAAWVGNQYPTTGVSGAQISDAIRLYHKPVTRVENFCASGMDAFRQACYAVAAGIHEVVLACGVEKLTDSGASGLPNAGRDDPLIGVISAPGTFGMVATRAFTQWGWTKADLAEIAVKNHANGVHHPKAHFRRAVTADEVLKAPMVAAPLGRLDCAAVSDGAAAVVVTTPERALRLRHGHQRVIVAAVQVSGFTVTPHLHPDADFLGFPATRHAAQAAYAEAGITNPAEELDVAEVHDCFTITELINYQDLGFTPTGSAVEFLHSGATKPGGSLVVNPSGGLKSFGHPIGATGCRMLYEITRQLQGRADGVQVEGARRGLAHNLGGPGAVAAVSILERAD
jgi:acetyl-CoA C-acetyltransferase